ncbi:hypothetical protein SPOG_01232 [Schizosaccharomyces cryophilus OY26]|uniref:Uncharacterized protein n=1 Tax=Schizosaccharomyces cryophilus (strain OY26 / ATCC MYA-4695 / CBS 11777 / NBRC 106824 / NRRL Y48691) TaxID=653667 RepID=S9VW65_SCHCR|nr:uncharacterized protein SPOG_01232 [Schizosaccharomyces cryophilus OY26]EPY50474.1 hypothetical protein SPOG_01232 [Schizosaccharomyces cryophilus OY26]
MDNQQLHIELDNAVREFRDGLQELSKQETHLKVVTHEQIQATLAWVNGEWEWEWEEKQGDGCTKKKFPSCESALLTISPSFQRWFHGQLESRLSSLF